MLRPLKIVLWIGLLAVGLQSASGFALLGPLNNGQPGDYGDRWQTPIIGYGLANVIAIAPPFNFVWLQDLGTPKNLGEEYRWNKRTLYWAVDQGFLDYFGSNGLVAVEQAFTIMNDLTNVSLYSPDLSEFGQQSLQVNFEAQALGLMDLKSVVLTYLVEQLGLAEPERYTWTLRDRLGTPCPAGMFYSVTKRNFDPLTFEPSSYVNGVLYTYTVIEICNSPVPPLAWTQINSVDPLAYQFTAVASFNVFSGPQTATTPFPIHVGGYYTGLTRDDVGGLRYLYRTNNMNIEDSGVGTTLITTNFTAPTLLTTLDFALFSSQATNNSAAALLGLYPGLIILSTTNYFLNETTSSVVAFYTNLPGSLPNTPATLVVQTNFFPNSVVSHWKHVFGNVVINDFTTNAPGFTLTTNVVTQLTTNPIPPQWSGEQLTTLDLKPFLDLLPTTPPTTLLTLYPGLSITSVATNPVFGHFTNLVGFLTNFPWAPIAFPPVLVTNGIVVLNLQTNYSYVFGNIVTNHYYTNWFVTNQTAQIVPQAFSIPPNIFLKTNMQTLSVTKTNVGGDFYILPPGVVGYYFFPDFVITNGTATNIISNVRSPNPTSIEIDFDNTVVRLTNYTYAVNQITIGPVTNITLTVTSNSVGGNIAGDFYLSSPTVFVSKPAIATNVVGTTNVIVTAVVPPGVSNVNNQSFTLSIVSFFTQHTFVTFPINFEDGAVASSLRQGVEKITFVRRDFDSLLGRFFQPVTNDYTLMSITNNTFVPQKIQRIINAPDILITAIDTGILPPYIQSINFDERNRLVNLAGPGTITNRTTLTLNKGTPIIFNLPNGTEVTQTLLLLWGSFDGSTNAPVVYPSGTSIVNLENQVLMQVTSTSLPDGTNGVAYNGAGFQLTGSGGQPPYAWSVAPYSAALPPGLSLSADGIISGMPTSTATFDFSVRMTDVGARIVDQPLTIIIH